MPKVGMVTLGCPKNLVNSEVMLGHLARKGYDLTPHPEEADILVVNTCSFIEPAKRESIDTILEMAEYKKSGSAKKLVVTGCLVERYRQEILSELPEVDFVIGTNELERLVEACALGSGARESARPIEPYLYHEFTPRVLTTPDYSATIKIAEGCDHPCSFCVIPQMRGRFRSRRFASVMREAGALARRGVREITLVGQDTTSYGEDLGLPGQVPAAVAKRRQRALMAVQRKILRRRLKEQIGKSFPVLVEGRSEETDLLFKGRLESQAPGIEGQVYINDFVRAEPQPGEFRWATLTGASDYDLVARLEAETFAERIVVRNERPTAAPALSA